MKSYPMAADGLKLMFYGEIISLVGIFLSLVSVIGVILCIVGPVLTAYGLFKAAGDDEGYRTAFYLTIAEVVVNLISAFCKDGSLLKSLLSIANTVLGLAVVYYVCTTTANLLHAVGQEEQSAKGRTVWLIYLICALVTVVVRLLALIPILNLVAGIVAIVLIIAQLVGYVLYMIFLSKSYKVL